jgi:DNA polymerase-3 subunit epsilon/ATP-dependent DNA helicase DinG
MWPPESRAAEYDYLVIDEGHHLEDATTNALSFQSTLGEIERTLAQLGSSSSGAMGWLLTATHDIMQPAELASLSHLVETTTDQAFRFQHQIREFFTSIEHFLDEQRENRPVGMYAQQERIVEATRIQPAWGEVELAWDEAGVTLSSLLKNLAQLAQGTAEIQQTLSEEDQELYSTLTNLYRRFDEFQANINAMIFEPTHEQIYWADLQPDSERLALHAAPLHIGSLMERYLWNEKSSVIVTSATLTTTGEFDYLKGRLSAQEADELALGSPFDYETAALLYLINDIPEPNDQRGHQRALETGLINLCRATGGPGPVYFLRPAQAHFTCHLTDPGKR